MLLKSIPDKGAVVAWQPPRKKVLGGAVSPLLAVATREGGGGGFDSYGGSLSLHAVDISSAGLDCPALTRCVMIHYLHQR